MRERERETERERERGERDGERERKMIYYSALQSECKPRTATKHPSKKKLHNTDE